MNLEWWELLILGILLVNVVLSTFVERKLKKYRVLFFVVILIKVFIVVMLWSIYFGNEYYTEKMIINMIGLSCGTILPMLQELFLLRFAPNIGTEDYP